MKGYSAVDRKHHETLRRIVALLLALAGLAERAACRSWPVRRVVLWLLRRAERVARAFAAQAGVLPLLATERLVPWPGDAGALARQFRSLAAALSALLHRAPAAVGGARQPGPGRRRPDAAWLDRLLLALRPRFVDTS